MRSAVDDEHAGFLPERTAEEFKLLRSFGFVREPAGDVVFALALADMGQLLQAAIGFKYCVGNA